MTALGADTNIAFRNKTAASPFDAQVKSATTIYQGAMVGMASQTTGALPASDTASQWFIGWAQRQVINATNGTSRVRLLNFVQALQLTNNILVTSIGVSGEVDDDSLADLAAGTTHHVEIGRIIEYVDSTHTWLFGGMNKGVIAT